MRISDWSSDVCSSDLDDGPADGRQGDAPKGLHRVGAEAARCLLLLDAHLLQHRHDLADDEGQGHEGGRHDDAGGREDDLEAEVFETRADPPAAADQPEERRLGKKWFRTVKTGW